MILRGVFIVGTDTGIGKTVVAAALNAVFHRGGVDAVPMKPVQTGCHRKSGGHRVSDDLEFCLNVAGINPSTKERNLMAPYCFKMPASPHLASEQEGQSIDMAVIRDCYRRLTRRHGLVILEGAGGLLVPLTRKKTTRDLIRLLNVPVIVVARPGLGTINHTLLTLNELNRAKIPVAGVIVNNASHRKHGLIEKDNENIIAALGGYPVIASLPYLPDINKTSVNFEKVRERLLAFLPPAGKIMSLLEKPCSPRT